MSPDFVANLVCTLGRTGPKMKLGYTILVLLFSNTLGSPVATEITSLLGTRSSAHEFISTDSSSLIHYEPKKFGDIAVIDRSSAIASTLVLVCITLCMTLVPSKCIDPGQLVNISSLPFIIPILWIFLIESVFSIATLTRLYQRHDVLSMFYEYSWPRFQTAFNSRCAVEVVVLLLRLRES